MIDKICSIHWPGHAGSTLDLLAAQSVMLEPLRSTSHSLPLLTPQAFQRALASAAANSNIEALELMLSIGGHKHDDYDARHLNCLLSYNPNPSTWHYLDESCGNAFHTAVYQGHDTVVQIPLQHGFDADTLDHRGEAPIHIAARRGHLDILALLLRHGVSIDTKTRGMQTAISLATSSGKLEAVLYLLNHGADLTVLDVNGEGLLGAASHSGDFAILLLLMQAGLIPSGFDIWRWYHLHHRAVSLMMHHFKLSAVDPILLATIPQASKTRSIVRLIPAQYRTLNMACRYYESGPTALYRAATENRLSRLRVLLEHGAMLNLEGGREGTPLMGASKAGGLSAVKYLVRHGATIAYRKQGSWISAFEKAKQHQKVQRWFLVERFTEQRRITAGVDHEGGGNSTLAAKQRIPNDDTTSDTTEAGLLDLVLEENIEQYLESKNWFLPTTRFIDRGDGAFDQVPIDASAFPRYRPAQLKLNL